MSDKMDTDPVENEEVKSSKEVAESFSVLTFADISRIVSYINKGVDLNQPRLLQRAIRQNAPIRRHVTKELLCQTVTKFIPSTYSTYQPILDAVGHLPATEGSADDKMSQDGGNEDTPSDAVIPEVEVYIYTLVVTTLLRHSLTKMAAYAATQLVDRIKSFSRRTLDLFSAKAFFYFSLAYERLSRLEFIRPNLLALYRTACLHRDDMSQAVLLNLLLRNYLHYNLVEQAQALSSKTTFPEGASNNQFCRYLFFMGRIQAIQLEYSEAYLRLTTAARKAPQDDSASKGFSVTVHKLTIIVQLLMGEIPERSSFSSTPFESFALKPYLFLTKAVRDGNLHDFSKVVDEHQETFKADKNYSLIQRLSHNVLKTGLRKISVSYSRISLADVASKLQLPSVSSAEYICARAIKDGVIEASISHEDGWLTSNEITDVYSTEEPQKAFHRRIVFCLDVHNEAVKAMRYPPDAYKKQLASSKKGKGEDANKDDEKTIDELIKEMEEDEDEM